MLRKYPYDEPALIALLREGSEYAFQLLFEQYHQRIYRVAMVYVKSPALAEDIVQDVFLKIWFQRKSLPELSSFESWICTVARNVTLNCLKKQAYEWKARRTWSVESMALDHTGDLTTEYKELLFQAVLQLPEQQQKVYRLARDKGFSYEDIASELSLSPLTVKTHMSRALASIRNYLQKHGKELLLLFIMEQIIF